MCALNFLIEKNNKWRNQKQYTFVQNVAWTRPSGWENVPRAEHGTP